MLFIFKLNEKIVKQVEKPIKYFVVWKKKETRKYIFQFENECNFKIKKLSFVATGGGVKYESAAINFQHVFFINEKVTTEKSQ